jgi:hypothetical protein
MGKKLKKDKSGFFLLEQVLGFVFHNTVEKPVDNAVDNLRKCAIITILDQIA